MRLINVFASLLLMASTSAFAISDFNLTWFNRTSDQPQTFNSADYKNTVFILEVYQLNCAPCNSNEPNVKALADFYKSNDKVKVLDLGIDQDLNSYTKWIARHQQNHPVLIDTGRTVAQQLGVQLTPTAYLLDCNKNVKWQHTGEWSAHQIAEIKGIVTSLATQRCTAD